MSRASEQPRPENERDATVYFGREQDVDCTIVPVIGKMATVLPSNLCVRSVSGTR
jgi:hypothetical protein